MEYAICLNDYDIKLLSSLIEERRSDIREELRELGGIGEEEEYSMLKEERADLAATNRKLAEAIRSGPN